MHKSDAPDEKLKTNVNFLNESQNDFTNNLIAETLAYRKDFYGVDVPDLPLVKTYLSPHALCYMFLAGNYPFAR